MKKKKKSKKHLNIDWYDARKISTNKNGQSAIEKFIDDIYLELGLRKPYANMEMKKTALNVIISNVVDKYISGKFIAIPFSHGYYTTATMHGLIYNTYEYIVRGTKALVRKEYLDYIGGHNNLKNPENNMVSRIRAKKKLIDAINSYTISGDQVQNYFETDKNVTYIFCDDEIGQMNFDDVVELKDKHKNQMSYRPNRISERSKKFLRAYNSFAAGIDVIIPLNKIKENKYPLLGINPHTTTTTNTEQEYTSSITIPLIGCSSDNFIIYKKLSCKIKRVFNDGSFKRGGRFYDADYQLFSKAERSWIRINGEPVVEIDYKCFHPRMLYHEMKINIKGDLYEMVHPDKNLRAAIKKMLNIMINSKGDYNAVEAFKNDMLKEDNKAEIEMAMLDHRMDEWDLIKLIRKAHKPIEQFFSSNVGIEKQYKDSIIAMRIMEHFLRKKILCLDVHDSFLVQEKYKDELYELMKTLYQEMFGFEPELEIIEKEQSI